MTDQPSEPQTHGVRIDAQPGHATISIDGTPLPAGQVIGYTLQHSVADQLPTLLLHTRQPDGVLWEGIARVAVASDQPPGQVVAAFLAEVDPAVLDQAALERAAWGDGKAATARAMLAILTEWALGQGSPA